MVRLKRLLAALQAHDAAAEAMVLTHPQDVRYLTGFTGSNAALVVRTRPTAAKQRAKVRAKTVPQAILFTDGRYTEQAKEETRGARVVIARGAVMREACVWMQAQGIRHCGFDAEHTTVAALDAMRQAIEGRERRSFFRPLQAPVARLREVKDTEEIARLRAAAKLGCELFEGLLTIIEAGAREVEVAAHLECAARMAGAGGMSFDTIVASGARSALPHGHATGQRLPRRGFVVLDFGVMLRGYCSDMTRTVHLGQAGSAERDAYQLVLEAQMAAIDAIRPGVTCGEVDGAARSVLRRGKLDRYFTHSTGHGVGLEIHEAPRVAARQPQKLEAGMVVTVEPGVYLPRRFGIRIEDMVLVTRRGPEVLTPAPKAWIEL